MEPERKRLRKPSMSRLTALSLSLANLWSKKARTALVAFAASIGIIGIALILSLSNGANAYIRRMEQESLSQYPLQIMSSAFSMEDSLAAFAQLRQEASSAESDGLIREQQMMGGFMASTATNDLAALKRWLDSGSSGMERYTRGVTYSYGISPQIYLTKEDSFRQVNPDQTLSTFGVKMDESLSGIMANYGASEVFRALPENPDMYRGEYELMAGRWPSRDTDCVVVLTGSGNIPDLMLYTMGLRDGERLDSMIGGVVAGAEVDTSLTESRTYSPEDFLGITFTLLPAFERFSFDEKLGVWTDCREDREAMLKLLKTRGQEMRITGVVRPKEGTSFGILELGIEYPPALLSRLMEEAKESPVVKAQLADSGRDVLTGGVFGETPEMDYSFLKDLIEIHPEELSEAVSFRWEDLDSLNEGETRLSAVKLVRIFRELRRTGDSPTLRDLAEKWIPMLMDLVEVDEEKIGRAISLEMGEARLQELEKLDEQLNDLRAERLAGVKTAKAPEETSDKAEQNEQEASEDDETASVEETAEDAQKSPVPVIRVESEAEPGQPGSGLSEAINDLFERVPSVNEAQDKVNQALDSLEEGLSQAGDRVDQALQELDDTLKGSPEK